MKVNKKILSLPPYISTSWYNVTSLHMNRTDLVVSLLDGAIVEIPALDPELIERIFSMHAVVLEEQAVPEREDSLEHGIEQLASSIDEVMKDGSQMKIPFKVGFMGMDNIGTPMFHNPDQSHLPNMPPQVLEKLRGIIQILAPGEMQDAPQAEPHCNCVYCQVMRSLDPDAESPEVAEIAEEISEDDLVFSDWEIHQEGENLYTVKNKLDSDELYSVYLGEPVGCTCGREGCEHIVAVLKS